MGGDQHPGYTWITWKMRPWRTYGLRFSAWQCIDGSFHFELVLVPCHWFRSSELRGIIEIHRIFLTTKLAGALLCTATSSRDRAQRVMLNVFHLAWCERRLSKIDSGKGCPGSTKSTPTSGMGSQRVWCQSKNILNIYTYIYGIYIYIHRWTILLYNVCIIIYVSIAIHPWIRCGLCPVYLRGIWQL